MEPLIKGVQISWVSQGQIGSAQSAERSLLECSFFFKNRSTIEFYQRIIIDRRQSTPFNMITFLLRYIDSYIFRLINTLQNYIFFYY